MVAEDIEEWQVDCADPSVGIFGDSIWHETCKKEDPEPAVEIDFSTRSIGNGTVRHTTTFECACGAKTSFDDDQPESCMQADIPDWWEE